MPSDVISWVAKSAVFTNVSKRGKQSKFLMKIYNSVVERLNPEDNNIMGTTLLTLFRPWR